MNVDDHQACRMCFDSQVHLIDIYDEFESNIADIISEHIGNVSKTDAFPKYVCSDCWQKTHEFHVFHRSVQQAQDNFLKRIVKREENEVVAPLNGDHFDPFECVDVPIEPDISERERAIQIEFKSNVEPETELELETENEFTPFDDTIKIDEEILSNIKQDETPYTDTDSDDDVTAPENPRYKMPEVFVSPEKKRVLLQEFDTTCDVCAVYLGTLKKAISHYKKYHKMEGYIKCCKFKFKKDIHVDDHIKWHVQPDIFKCPMDGCDKSLGTRLSLQVHINYHNKRFECDICKRTFAQFSKLSIHMTKHSNEKFTCHICSKIFRKKEKLNSHLQYNHRQDIVEKQKKYLNEMAKMELSAAEIEHAFATYCDMKCDMCDVIFKSLADAQYHYMGVHGLPDGHIKCCTFIYRDIQKLSGHIFWHLNPGALKCAVCSKELKSIAALRTHLRIHEVAPLAAKNQCPICQKEYDKKIYLSKHMRLIHKIGAAYQWPKVDDTNIDRIEEFFNMKCEQCDFTFKSLHEAKLHYFDAHNIHDGYLKCCDLKFRANTQINDHIQFHLDPEQYRCKICAKILPRTSDLRQHISIHKVLTAKRYACEVCGRVFHSNYLLNKHSKKHDRENSNEIVSCDNCHRKFANETYLEVHKRKVHSKEAKEAKEAARTFLCQKCGKSFRTLASVNAHSKLVHRNDKIAKFQCEMCKRSYQTLNSLRTHIKLIHESKPEKCPQCDKTISNPIALTRHIKIVHENEMYECHVCHKQLKSSQSFKMHVATHSSDKLYKCSFCSDTFNWRSNMYIHQKKSHPEEWQSIQAPKGRQNNCK